MATTVSSGAGITELGLPYAVGILPGTAVWCPGEAPLPPAASSGRGRPAKRLRRDATHRPVSVKALAMELAPDDWQEIAWREGSNTALSSRFARLRVRPAHGDATRSEPAAEEWLLIEWPEGETEPDHYWLCTLPADIAFERTVDLTNPRIKSAGRWRIERDYLELKQEVGLGHYEGRGWRGFHRHASLCIAAHGFLISEKETIPPSGPAHSTGGSQPNGSGGACVVGFAGASQRRLPGDGGRPVTLRSRLERLEPRRAPSFDDLSDDELRARLVYLHRKRLDVLTLPAEVRADLTDEIADLETGRFQCDPGRGARIRAYLRARFQCWSTTSVNCSRK